MTTAPLPGHAAVVAGGDVVELVVGDDRVVVPEHDVRLHDVGDLDLDAPGLTRPPAGQGVAGERRTAARSTGAGGVLRERDEERSVRRHSDRGVLLDRGGPRLLRPGGPVVGGHDHIRVDDAPRVAQQEPPGGCAASRRQHDDEDDDQNNESRAPPGRLRGRSARYRPRRNRLRVGLLVRGGGTADSADSENIEGIAGPAFTRVRVDRDRGVGGLGTTSASRGRTGAGRRVGVRIRTVGGRRLIGRIRLCHAVIV